MHAAAPRHYQACNYIFGITWSICTCSCHSNKAIFILSLYFFKRTKYQFLILVLITGSPISGRSCCHHNIYNILKGWQLPNGNGFWSVRTIYTNLHTKIFTLKHGKFEKKTYSGGTMTSLQHLTSIILLWNDWKLENFGKIQTFEFKTAENC